jgi:hypothetical protein
MATKTMPAPVDSAAAEKERRAKRAIQKFGTPIETVRLYVERKLSGETSEGRDEDELDDALEQLNLTRARLPALIELAKAVNQNQELIDNYDDISAHNKAETVRTKAAMDAAQEAFRIAKGNCSNANSKQRIDGEAYGQLTQQMRGCRLLFGTIEEAVQELFPPPAETIIPYPNDASFGQLARSGK